MLLHFLIGFLCSFMGTLAIGPTNLGVINITIRHNMHSAARFSMAASLVELVYATAAILFGKLIINKIDEFPGIKIIVILFFFLAGVYFFFKKEKEPESEDDQPVNKSFFLKGIIVALINPQTIPYWLFVTTYLTSHEIIHLSRWNLVFFLTGGFVGKYLTLSLYGMLSEYLKKRTSRVAFYLNKFIGLTLIVISVLQATHFY